jgi:nitrate/nitrite-specific signal transduction histidine kinase
MDALVETNDLLAMLNAVASRLPVSLSVRDALDSVREQLAVTFAPSGVCLRSHDEQHGEWIPKLAEGCVLRPGFTTDDLPRPLRRSLDVTGSMLAGSFRESGISVSSRSGMYVCLRVRDRVVGVLGLEHPDAGHFGQHHAALLDDLAQSFALMLDNAVRYGRLRSLGTEEERTRIARELHDRLGQWLTYVGFELERITAVDRPSAVELGNLRSDVDHALDELRETLRQLRSEVTQDQPLARVGGELLQRFRQRTELSAEWRVSDPDARLSVPVENELLRILLESLSNIDRHAKATSVEVRWDVRGGVGTLTVTDDGCGFVPDQVVRDSAYGLVGMRERAGVIGARLKIDSAPGRGTTIAVTTGATTDTQEI